MKSIQALKEVYGSNPHLAARFRMTASKRPNKHQGLDPYKKPGHSLHHIIPWHLIKKTIDVIAKTNDSSLWWELADLFELPDHLRFLPNIKAENAQTSLICWAPFNLVDGPKVDFRCDDPGGDFDDFTSALDDPKLIERMHKLRDLNQSMKTFTEKYSSDARADLFFKVKMAAASCHGEGVICFEDVAWHIQVGGFVKRAA